MPKRRIAVWYGTVAYNTVTPDRVLAWVLASSWGAVGIRGSPIFSLGARVVTKTSQKTSCGSAFPSSLTRAGDTYKHDRRYDMTRLQYPTRSYDQC